MNNKETNSNYHRAKWWQLALFPLNNTATNLYMTLMGYISYYLAGFAGIGVVVAGIIMTAMRIWDGITDPIIGFILDKTDGKFGKNRPFMVLGNITLAIMAIIIFKTTHLVPKRFSLIYFIFVYAIYIVGYTLQCVVTKSAQSCLTNDPNQRPVFALFGLIFNVALIALFIFGNPTTLSLTNISLFTVLFLTFTILGKWAAGVAGPIVIPMTADCADYETYRCGKYVPGIMGTLFNFVDKIISSFGTTIVFLSIAAIGFTTAQPTADTPYTTSILVVSLALMFGLTIFGLVCNLIAMKLYPLTKEKMEEIQDAIAEIKEKAKAEAKEIA